MSSTKSSGSSSEANRSVRPLDSPPDQGVKRLPGLGCHDALHQILVALADGSLRFGHTGLTRRGIASSFEGSALSVRAASTRRPPRSPGVTASAMTLWDGRGTGPRPEP